MHSSLKGASQTQVLPAALAGLQDRDDDVRSAAADALYPVVGALASSAGDEDVRAVPCATAVYS